MREQWMDEGACSLYMTEHGGQNLWISDDAKDQDRAADLCLDCRCSIYKKCEAYAQQQLSHNNLWMRPVGVYAGKVYGQERRREPACEPHVVGA